ncbi:MAG: Na+/H+ antiporter subunit E [Clostridia bacterium]|nr:Na+/H+ antiporter subunit E [Clostridia bacterium]
MKKYLSTFIFCYGIWILLSGIAWPELLLGLLVAAIVAFLAKRIFSFELGWDFPLKALLFIFLYIPVFIYALVKANIDVAFRVLSPKIPINPGFVRIPTGIKGELGKLTLANSITLTPGTISLDADDDSLYIHWIDVKGNSEEEYQQHISGTFEKVLRRIFK